MIPIDWRIIASTVFVISLTFVVYMYILYDFFSEKHQYKYLLCLFNNTAGDSGQLEITQFSKV